MQRNAIRYLQNSEGAPARLAIATPSLTAYSETFIRAHIERLGNTVTVLHGGDDPPLYADHTLTLLPAPLRVLSHIASAALNVERQRLELGVARHVSRSVRNRCVANHLSVSRAEAVLAEYGPTGVGMMSACSTARMPLIVHFHGYDAYRQDVLEGVGRLYPELFEQAAAIITVSRDMLDQVQKLGAPTIKTHYNPCGVNVEMFDGASPATNPPLLAAVGRFVEKKAPHLTILAFARARERVGRARLVMAGDGPLLDACRQLALALGIESDVDFRGALAPEDIATLMRRARAFVQHSVRAPSGDAEGTPVAVIEASAAGLPVIATRHMGIKDVVQDGVTGLLVEEGDVEGMAVHMEHMLVDAEQASTLGKAGRARVMEHFSLDAHLARLRQIIHGVIKGHGGASSH